MFLAKCKLICPCIELILAAEVGGIHSNIHSNSVILLKKFFSFLKDFIQSFRVPVLVSCL